MTSTNGDFGSSGWQIEEHESYDESVLYCGGYPIVDEAIAWVDVFLNINPLALPLVHDESDIRIIKTKLRIKGTTVIPAYRLLFAVDKDRRKVTKLHVSMSEPEHMAFGDPWDEFNEPTF